MDPPIIPTPLFHHPPAPAHGMAHAFDPVNHPVFRPRYTLDDEQKKKIQSLYQRIVESGVSSDSTVTNNGPPAASSSSSSSSSASPVPATGGPARPTWSFDQWRYIHDGGCMARYLRARDWDVDKAEQLLRSTLAWRESYKVAEISPLEDKISFEGETGKTYRNGTDLLKRPIIYMKPRFQNSKDSLQHVRFTVHNLERCMESMDQTEGVEQMVLLIDFSGYSLMNAPPMSVTKEVMGILLNCYPERLGLALMIDSPMLFNMAYRVIYPFLPTETRKKIHFISGNREEKRRILSEFISPSVLEYDYGGDNKCRYDHGVYKQRECEDLSKYSEHVERHPLAHHAQHQHQHQHQHHQHHQHHSHHTHNSQPANHAHQQHQQQ